MPRLLPGRICPKSKNPLADWRVGQDLKIAGYLRCRLARMSHACACPCACAHGHNHNREILAAFHQAALYPCSKHLSRTELWVRKGQKTSNTEGRRQRRNQVFIFLALTLSAISCPT